MYTVPNGNDLPKGETVTAQKKKGDDAVSILSFRIERVITCSGPLETNALHLKQQIGRAIGPLNTGSTSRRWTYAVVKHPIE